MRCMFDKACTDLFFGIIDRRYEKDMPNALIPTSNTSVNNWDEFFTGNETLLRALDRVFDRATAFMMKSANLRGTNLENLLSGIDAHSGKDGRLGKGTMC